MEALYEAGFVVALVVSDAAGENRSAMNKLMTISAKEYFDSKYGGVIKDIDMRKLDLNIKVAFRHPSCPETPVYMSIPSAETYIGVHILHQWLLHYCRRYLFGQICHTYSSASLTR